MQNPLVFHSEALVTLAGRVRELHKETEAELLKIQSVLYSTSVGFPTVLLGCLALLYIERVVAEWIKQQTSHSS